MAAPELIMSVAASPFHEIKTGGWEYEGRRREIINILIYWGFMIVIQLGAVGHLFLGRQQWRREVEKPMAAHAAPATWVLTLSHRRR